MEKRAKKPKETRPLTSFGMWVKRELLERQMTGAELCRRVGIAHLSYLSRILHGEISGAKYMGKIIEELGSRNKSHDSQ